MKWDGRYVAGVSKVSALKRTTEVVKHREGGDPSSVAQVARPHRSIEAITLERGVTHDMEFEQWANKVWNYGAGLGAEVSLADFRKDIIIELLQRGRPAGDRLQGLPLLGLASTRRCPTSTPTRNAVAIQHIKLENEGWERDTTVTEPKEVALAP